MNIKQFYSLNEIQKYYDEKTNTYVFKDNDEYIDLVVFNFNLNVEADIDAYNITACNIVAYDINACNINVRNIDADNINAYDIYAWNIHGYNIYAWDIDADDISYYAVCFAYNNIKCKSIKGRRKNAKHFVLDGKLEVEENDKY